MDGFLYKSWAGGIHSNAVRSELIGMTERVLEEDAGAI
jgi:hypothetical protein